MGQVDHMDLEEYLPKRLKTKFTPDYSEFQSGSIIRCKLTNFMSYSLTEFHFGPKMNLIIGPNGSGKSTFVCAVCIGLGGKLSYLGKENMQLDGFIKDKTDEAIVELELRSSNNTVCDNDDDADDDDDDDDNNTNNEESVTIQRTIIRGRKKTTWRINNKLSTDTEIRNLLKNYNIQLDSLCQFLPQDRVSKFADLKSEELLKEIERSYNSGELLKQHEEIIQLFDLIELEKKNVSELNVKLAELNEKNIVLKEKAQKRTQYLNLEKDLDKFLMIKPYVSLQEKKQKRVELKKIYNLKKEKFQTFQNDMLPLENSLKLSDNSVKKLKTKITELNNLKNLNSKSQEKIKFEITESDKKIEVLKMDIESIQSQIENLYQKYSSYKEEFLNVSKSISKLNKPDRDEYKIWRAKRTELNSKITEINFPIEDLKHNLKKCKQFIEHNESRIRELNSNLSSEDRLMTLDQRKFSEMIRAVKSLRSFNNNNNNNGKGNGTEKLDYFEPALITLNVNDKRCGAVLERLIRYSNLNAFVASNNDNYKKLSKILYDNLKCKVSIRTISNNFNFNPIIPRDEIIELGFDGYIIDFISGPKEVIQMICENENIQNIPISFNGLTNDLKMKIQSKINNGLKIFKYVSGESIYTFNRSNFGKRQISTNIRNFNINSSIFTNGLSEDQKTDIKNRIRINRENIETKKVEYDNFEMEFNNKISEKKDFEVESNDLDRNIKNFNSIEQNENKLTIKLENIKDRMKAIKIQIKKLKNQDNEEDRNKIYSKITEIKVDQFKKLKLLGKIITEMTTYDSKLIKINTLCIEELNKIDSINMLNESIFKEKELMINELNKVKEEFRLSKIDYENSLNEYQIKLSNYSVEEKNEMKNIVEELQSKDLLNEENLNLEIKKIKSRLQLNENSSSEVSIKLLEENEKNLIEINEQIPKLNQSINDNELSLENVFKVWKPKLDEIIKILSNDFNSNMSKIASSGDVKLDSSEKDFSKWKLILLVSFRDNEGLTQFNGAQHSGGEKSTTTAIFLNSLQGLTNTPFRIVDEINQGMDIKNERRAHKLIVEKASLDNANTSQYFLITPKLLNDLYYGEKMAVHCILAGRWCPPIEDNVEFLEMGITQKYV